MPHGPMKTAAFLHLFFCAVQGMSPSIKALYDRENADEQRHVKIQNAKLINAILKSDIHEISAALDGGASLDHARCMNGGEPPLILAAKYGRTTILPFLLSKQPDTNITHGNHLWTPLFYAICAEVRINDKLQMIRNLLDAGADIHYRDISGGTPLVEAVRVNSAQTVEFLLQRGARINVRNRYGKSLLECVQQNKRILKLLLDAGENPNYKKKGGHPIMFEIAFMLEQDTSDYPLYALEELVRHGADLTIPNQHGDNLLAIAAKYRIKPLAQFCVAHKVRANIRNVWGDTPLDIAQFMFAAFKDQNTRDILELISGASSC